MSHNVSIAGVKITDLNALQAAISELQQEGSRITFEPEGKAFRTWPGQPNSCDAVIRLPAERFDVGLRKQADGSYVPIFDHMLNNNQSISCEVPTRENRMDGRFALGRLLQRYAVCVAEQQAAAEGHMVSRNKDDAGNIVLTVDM